MVLYFTRPATINPMCPGTVFLRSIPKNHNFSSDSAVRNRGFLWEKGTLAKQTSRKSPFTTINQQANCWCWTFQTSFWARWGHCGCKRDDFKKVSQTICLSSQDEAVVFRLESPKKNGKNRPWEKKQKDKRLGKRFCFNPGKAFFQPQGFFSLKDCLDWTKRVTFTLGPARPASNIVNMRSAWCWLCRKGLDMITHEPEGSSR